MPFKAKPECLCLLDFKCVYCQRKEADKPDPLAGYGYDLADVDGHDGGQVSPEDHKEEEFLAAAEMRLDAKQI